MPIDKSKYPPNWKEITKQNLMDKHYTCEYCLRGYIRKNSIGSHHIDHDPMNNVKTNLGCLHARCHLLFHSVFDTCRTPQEFKEICKNYRNQLQLRFMHEPEYSESQKVI